MKILFYISTIRGGGAARVMVNIANSLAEKNYDICFVTNFPSAHEYVLVKTINRIDIESKENNKGAIVKNYIRLKKLRKIIKTERPDVCVSFMKENNFRLILSSRGIYTKTIVSIRNDPAKEYPTKISWLLARILYKKADGIVFQTEDAQNAFPDRIRRKGVIIFNQVDDKFYFKREHIGDYILACGRLSKQKNYHMMLKAFSEVVKKNPGEQLRIYGEGILKEELLNLTDELDLSNSVQFMGYSKDMTDVYRNAKILLMTSEYEGMPNVILESLASSVPVISTDCPCGGPRKVIKNGENGFLVPVDGYNELVSVMEKVLSDKDLLVRMGCTANKMAEEFKGERVLGEWEKFITSS